MNKLARNKRLNLIMLFGAMILIWIVMTFAMGPPDEAPPFITPGP
ncbi:MAG: hypothetical protein ACFFDW_17130 [Candidatus Thorarchaeota archaeon]